MLLWMRLITRAIRQDQWPVLDPGFDSRVVQVRCLPAVPFQYTAVHRMLRVGTVVFIHRLLVPLPLEMSVTIGAVTHATGLTPYRWQIVMDSMSIFLLHHLYVRWDTVRYDRFTLPLWFEHHFSTTSHPHRKIYSKTHCIRFSFISLLYIVKKSTCDKAV